MTAHTRNQFAAAFFTAIGAFVTWNAFGYSYNSSFFLRGLALTLLVLGIGYCLVLFMRGRASAPEGDVESEEVEQESSRPFLALHVFALVAGYSVLMYIFGFLLSTFLFVLLGQWSFSPTFKWRHLYYSVALTFFAFFLFFDALGVTLPNSVMTIDDYFRFL